jgi:hypothetical protein
MPEGIGGRCAWNVQWVFPAAQASSEGAASTPTFVRGIAVDSPRDLC